MENSMFVQCLEGKIESVIIILWKLLWWDTEELAVQLALTPSLCSSYWLLPALINNTTKVTTRCRVDSLVNTIFLVLLHASIKLLDISGFMDFSESSNLSIHPIKMLHKNSLFILQLFFSDITTPSTTE